MTPTRAGVGDDPSYTRAQALYQLALGEPSWTPEKVRSRFGWSGEELSEALSVLSGLGLVTGLPDAPSGWCALPPQVAVGRLIEAERRSLQGMVESASRTHAALTQVIEGFQPLHSAQRAQVEVALERSEVSALLEEVSRVASFEVLALQPAPAPTAAQIDESRTRNNSVLGRGVVMRTIYQQSSATLPHMSRYLRDIAATGARIRLLPSLPLRMIIVDEVLAVVSAGPPQQSSEAIVVRNPLLIRVLRQIFEHYWVLALDLLPQEAEEEDGAPAVQQDHPPRKLTARHEEVVRMLAAGLTDEAISRKLGLSDRTVRRVVSELMTMCSAESRFQAGVSAVRLGWLAETPQPG